MERGSKVDKIENNMRATWRAILQQDLALRGDKPAHCGNNGWCDALLPSEVNSSEWKFERLEETFISKCQIDQETFRKKECLLNVEGGNNFYSSQSTQSSDETISAVDEDKSSSNYTGDGESSSGSCQSLNEVR